MGMSGGVTVKRKLFVSGEAIMVTVASGVSAVSPLVRYSPLVEKVRLIARVARLPLRSLGDTTCRANLRVMRVARSS